MARGTDEAHNPNRRPQRPQTEAEKMAIVKQVFPNAQEVDTDEDLEPIRRELYPGEHDDDFQEVWHAEDELPPHVTKKWDEEENPGFRHEDYWWNL